MIQNKRKRNWIQLFSGNAFYPFNPKPEDIHIEDIAHSLAYQCRFNAHSNCFYSVAQHSIMVMDIVAAQFKLIGLLHDATEAYVADVPRPIKVYLPEYEKIEQDIWEKAIAPKFNLPLEIPKQVIVADDIALATEARDLMKEPPQDWRLKQKPLEKRINLWECLDPETAERRFLEVFKKLV